MKIDEVKRFLKFTIRHAVRKNYTGLNRFAIVNATNAILMQETLPNHHYFVVLKISLSYITAR